MSTTTIRISRETKSLLEKIGHKGQTFDDLVKLGAIEVSNKEKVFITNLGVETPNGVEYIEIRVPKHINKIKSTNLFGMGFEDALAGLCEENNIQLGG